MSDRWSFSRISSYEQCPYQYYLQYIEKRESIDNFYASFGSLIHKLLEELLNHEITYEEAVNYYMEYHPYEICDDAPSSIIDSYFEKGLDYLAEVSFDWMFDEFDILGVEKEVKFEVNGEPFIGYIDLLLKNKESGDLVIVDHKSSKYPFSKTGKLLKACADQQQHYENQMFLYAKAIHDELGVYPVQLTWNYFKAKAWYSIPFTEAGLEKALKWATEKISEISKDDEFQNREDYFYCNNLCGFRNTCEYKIYESEEDDGTTSSAHKV